MYGILTRCFSTVHLSTMGISFRGVSPWTWLESPSWRCLSRWRDGSTVSVLATNRSVQKQSTRQLHDNLRLMPTGTKLTSGNMVEFRTDGQLLLGVVQGQQKDRWIVHDETGEEKFVRGQDISLVVPGVEYTRHDIEVFLKNAAGMDLSLVEISWQIMEVTNQPLPLEKMAELLLGNNSPVSLYTAYSLLKMDRRFFKQISRDPPLYFRMTPQEVQTQLKEQQKLLDKQRDLEKFKERVSEVLKLKYVDRPGSEKWLEGEHRERIEALKEYALGEGPILQIRNLAMESLRFCDLTLTPNGALRLLEALRVISKHQPIAFIRAGIQIEFSSEIQSAAQLICEQGFPDPDLESRRDLTSLKTLSIDDKGTREIDDALSLETLPNGESKVWMHVSDPTRWIELDSIVDLEARRRATSLYTPVGTVPVYPWNLAGEQFSLSSGNKKDALSFGATLNSKGTLSSYEIIPSTVIPTSSLTYQEVDEMLEKDSDKDLTKLFEIAKLRYAWRISQGAMDISMPECDVKVKFLDEEEEPELTVSYVENKSISRRLVSEFMILAGEIAGRIGLENKLPLPYRSQVAPVLPNNTLLEKIPEGFCRDAVLRSRMTRGVTSSTNVKPHRGLGVDYYVQVTSPIRRYSDFLAHIQLKSFLRGDRSLPLTAIRLDELLSETARVARSRALAAGEVYNYWIAEFFRRHQEDGVWTATLLLWSRQSQGLAQVLIDELGLERRMKLQRPGKPGDKIKICVAAVDVKNGSVRFEEVQSKGGRLVMDA